MHKLDAGGLDKRAGLESLDAWVDCWACAGLNAGGLEGLDVDCGLGLGSVVARLESLDAGLNGLEKQWIGLGC